MALVVHLSILVTTATAAGLKIRVYDHDGFYCHFNYVPVQKLRDIQVYRGRCWNSLQTLEFVEKTNSKSWLPVFTSSPPTSALIGDIV